MRFLFLTLATTMLLAAPACVTDDESADDRDALGDGAQVDPAYKGWAPSGGGVIGQPVPGPGPTANPPPTKVPYNCQSDNTCDAKCDAAAALYPSADPDLVNTCKAVCKETDGGYQHAPGAFMQACVQDSPPNGCGPDGPGGALVPDGDWGACCDAHDACYLAGGDSNDRCACDQALRLCMPQNSGGGIYNAYFEAVRKLGCDFYTWGPSGHPGLTPADTCNDYWGFTCPLPF